MCGGNLLVVRKFALLLAFLPFAVLSQDICRDQFVSCVQQTGDSFACRSTYTNCQNGLGNDLVSDNGGEATATGELVFRPELTNVSGGLDGVRLIVSNPTNQPIQVANLTYEVRCANGSTDRAVFFLNTQINANVDNQSVGAAQVVCAVGGGAVSLMEQTPTAEGMASVASQLRYEYPCASGEQRWITLFYQDQGFYRWENSSGYQGSLQRNFVSSEDFASLACSPVSAPESTLIQRASEQILEWFDSPGNSREIRFSPLGNPGGVRG